MPLSITWGEFYTDTKSLVEKIKNSYKPDILVPIMRGGLIPSGIISEELGIKDVRPIDVIRSGKERRIVYTIQGEISNSNLLLVEDAVPTGGSVLQAKEEYGRVAIVKAASVYIVPEARGIDYYARCLEEIPNLPWKPSRKGDRIR